MDVKEMKKIKEMLVASGVETAYVFGSYAKNRHGPMSDFDIGIIFESHVSHAEQVDLTLNLSGDIAKVLGVERVDVVNLEITRSPLLKHNIIFEGNIILDSNPKKRFIFEKRVLEEYEDTKHLRATNYKIMKQQIRDGTYGGTPLSPAQEKVFQKYATR